MPESNTNCNGVYKYLYNYLKVNFREINDLTQYEYYEYIKVLWPHS